MKKLISLVMCVCLFFSVGVFAQNAQAQETDAERYANLLHNINLFYGDEGGYSLATKATRVESVTMVLRLRGDEKEALNQNLAQPFSDVPTWASNYIAYAYQNQIASGMTDTTFGSNESVTANQYLTFVLRALGYSDKDGDFAWNSAVDFAQGISLITQAEATELKQEDFTREQMVAISYKALSQSIKNSQATLSSVLVNKGVVAEGAIRSVGVKVVFNDSGSATEPVVQTPPQATQTETNSAMEEINGVGVVYDTGSKNLLVRAAPGGTQIGSFAPGSSVKVLRAQDNCYYVTGKDVTTGYEISGYCVKDYIALKDEQNTTTAADPTIEEKIAKLRLKFPNGSYWNHIGGPNNPDGVTSLPCTHHGTGACGYYADDCDCNSFNNAIQCLGFAYKIGNELFGTNVRQWQKFYDYDSLRVGDHVRYYSGSREHSVIVLSKTDSGITIVDCNYDGQCGIRWDAFIPRETLESSLIYYQTGQSF